MDQNPTPLAPEAATHEPASPINPHLGPPPDSAFAEPPLVSDCLGDVLADRIADTIEASFPPGARKPRYDGFTPEKIAAFLRDLAATGVVEHAAAAAGLSAAAAYAFRNRRQGRAFAKMWDAVLVHRTRARLASELQGRAIAGCVSVRRRDGEVVGEYHYYDNRLAMALLTRLDRLADREAASEAHLRALSEDLDEFIDCLAEGGDADAFVEARRPREPEPPPAPPAPPRDDDPELTRFARLAGCSDYLGVDPLEIKVLDLNLAEKGSWDADQWVRAYRSGFMVWRAMADEEDRASAGAGAALEYHFRRKAACAAAKLFADESPPTPEEAAQIPTDDLDPECVDLWSDEQLARASRSGLLGRLPREFWDALLDEEAAEDEEE
jgi:hypothetical protein